MTWWNRPRYKHLDGIICDGAVRSGKTVAMAVGFILWAMAAFDGEVFGVCGKTIESLRRNVVTLLPGWLEGVVAIRERRSENKLLVTVGGRSNSFYLFGGRDESSYALIQGITLAGVLFDEVALMPRSFVDQALARCSVTGSKFWFNCNPEGPEHWFYNEWVLKCRQKNILHLHFTMEDNNSLAKRIKRRYEDLYSGVFYDRYIKGEWVKAEGLIYPMFERARHVFGDEDAPPKEEGLAERWYISCDYGTQNPFAALLWREYDGVLYAMAEYYHDGRKNGTRTDVEHMDALLKLAGGREIDGVVIDPSAASMKAVLRQVCEWTVRDAKNDVVPGIANTATALSRGIVKFHARCENTIREFGLYAWDEKAKEDRPMKENDHAMDAVRYFVHTVVRRSYIWDEMWTEGAKAG